jgi:hypothetical protein
VTVYVHSTPCSVTSTNNNTEYSLPYQSGTYTFKNLYVNYGTPGTSSGDSVELYVGGNPTQIACPPTSGTQCLDDTHTYTFTITSPGETYSLRITSSDAGVSNVNATVQLQ